MNALTDLLLWLQCALCALTVYRVLRGPTIADRMVAAEILGILVVGICALMAIKTGRHYLIDIGIAWIIFSFIGTLAFAKYLEGRKLNE
jgi:multicomponent Na+:H+ antiporter subunit F